MPLTISDIAAAGERKILELDTISQNLANVSTPGFKSFHLLVQTEPGGETLPESTPPQYSSQIVVDYSQGQLEKTGNPLDLAIEGEGFFVIRAGEGLTYTRRGTFTINSSHELVTLSGERVQGDAGPIVIRGNDVHIDEKGVVYCDGSSVGQVKLVDFTNREALVPTGGGGFVDPGNAGAKNKNDARVHAGYLEMSNARPVQEMVAMIEVQRSFEMYQKLIQNISDQDRLATSRVGRLA